MKKLLPLLMLLVGTGAGVGAGVFLRPDPAPDETPGAEETAEQTAPETTADETEPTAVTPGAITGKEYVRLTNQFVVPIVEQDRVAAMVVMSLSVEIPLGKEETVLDLEPKIRDVFLRVLFDHAAIGGFRGDFARNDNLDVMRENLLNAARRNFGSELISDVLIFEIARQDY